MTIREGEISERVLLGEHPAQHESAATTTGFGRSDNATLGATATVSGRRIIFTYSFDRERRLLLGTLVSSLALVTLATTSQIEPIHAQSPVNEQDFDFDCNPVNLYHGDTLTVTFHSKHDDAELAIRNADGQAIVVSFNRAPEDRIDSPIPHEKFAKMKQVKINTVTATGSLMKDYAHGKTRAVLERLQPIFTKTGNYDILVGTDLRSPNGGIDVCNAYYYDYPRRRNKR
jgi:hypothetical protein